MKLQFSDPVRQDEMGNLETNEYAPVMQTNSAEAEALIREVLEGHKGDPVRTGQQTNHLDAISEMAAKDGTGMNYEFNAATMTDGDTGLFNPEVFRTQGIGRPPRPNLLLASMNVQAVNSGAYIDWIEQEARTGVAGTRLQDAQGGTSETRQYKEYSVPMIMVSADITVTREQLTDSEWLRGDLVDELTRDVRTVLSDQVLNGDGLGANMTGIFSLATAFDAGDFAAAVTGATTRDVILCAINQAQLANFEPNLVVLNPQDYTAMKFGWEGPLFDIPVFTSTQVTKDNYLVMDGTRATVFIDEMMRVGFYEQHSDNAIYNRVTAILHSRAALKLQNQHTGGFIKGVLSTDLAEIDATP